MIIDSLVIMLLGMAGVFAVMGIIFLCLIFLRRLSPGERSDKPD